MATQKMSIANSDDFLRSLLGNIPFGIIALNKSSHITIANQLAKEYLGLKPLLNELINLPFLECIKGNTVLYHSFSVHFKDKGGPLDLESINIRDKYLDINVRLIPDGSLIFIDDITRLKELESNAVQSILAGQEKERRRIAREIHDGIGPLLSFAKLELDSFIDDFSGTGSEMTTDKLVLIKETIDSITADLRDLSHRLMPRLLLEFGLYSAFSNLVHRINASNQARVELYCNFNAETRFDREIELNIFRCGQELLNNAIKHAGAMDILIQLIKHESSLVLMVEDDGIGFSQGDSDYDNFGIGLTNIDTRARSLNGEFLIESRANKGTTASIEIPV